jgi:nitrate reductase alpha subunit
LPLLDSWIRKVDADKAQGGKYYSNYTWHGDQDPSHPFWNGTQNCDVDLSDMRFSKLNTSWGKNFVENKMPEAHWKLESIERGARIVVITPEYNPTAYRADYWIPLRPETDGANFLGAAKIISMRICRISITSRNLPTCRCSYGRIRSSISIRAM